MPPIRKNHLQDDKFEKDSNTPQPDVEHEHQQATYTFPSEMAASSSEELPATDFLPAPSTTQRTSHGKRRDASYIPRPPNAFILFRSSFVRDQKVTNKVEGNHSNLSKIIGKYWKALPKEQRDEWEAKAAQALIDHRKRYPDWRFRPASNTTANNAQTKAKGKSATGGGSGSGGVLRRQVSLHPHGYRHHLHPVL
ncbi:hypothetical protein H0H93_013796 [Arthromyces matolae]|nr:hypothetical protein H0H93_013796 [Arthromyces matolae]